MEKIVLIVHVLAALAIIGMILIQQGKGAEAGASFGSGASQTVFGSAGGWNFFSKVTAILATVFFVTSFGLAYIARENSGVQESLIPELEIVQPDAGVLDIPVSDTGVDESDIPVLQDALDQAEDVQSALDIPDQQ